MSSLKKIITEFHTLANPKKATILAGFFKTGKGEYGEGDTFLGITVPQTRAVVKRFAHDCTLEDVKELLANAYHEIRLAGVLFLVYFVEKKISSVREVAECYLFYAGLNFEEQKKIFKGGDMPGMAYRTVGAGGIRTKSGKQPIASFCPLNAFGTFGNKSTKSSHLKPGINNWDLVDVSSPQIIGPYIHTLPPKAREKCIDTCIRSSNLWINRIIVLASFYDIRQGDPKLTLYLAEKFLDHKHDLMHKAVGWMLREVGKRCSMDELRKFLDKNAHEMPRTMLRYAIEKMNEKERQKYLAKI